MCPRPLIVLDALPLRADPTGVGRAILELTAALAARDRGLDFIVLSSGAPSLDFLADHPGWRVRVCSGAGAGAARKALCTQWQVPRLCRVLGADLLHSMQFIAPVFIAPLAQGCRSVVTVHDLAWRMHPGTVEVARRLYYRLLVGRSLAGADAILANSASTAADIRRLYPATADRIRLTPFGTPGWVWAGRQPGEPPPGVVGESPGPPYFLYVGALEPRKNLEALLGAYRRFLARCEREGRDPGSVPELRLVAAPGWQDRGIRLALQQAMATGKVHLRPYCQPAELGPLYRGARGLLFPSVHEGFGFPILEAMACGCPVMTSARGAMQEVAGRAALLVDPDSGDSMAEGIFRLAWDRTLRENLQKAGYLHAAAWGWTRTAEATVAVYEEILAGAGSRF